MSTYHFHRYIDLRIATCLFAAFAFVFFPIHIRAQTVSTPIDSNASYHQGEVFTVPIVIESSVAPINAFTVTVAVPQNVEYVGSDEAGSIVSLWVEAPHIDRSSVVFSGILPTGFTQVINPLNQSKGPGLITKLIFRGKKEGNDTLLVTPALYANDGAGTELNAAGFSIGIAIDNVVAPTSYAWNDAILPELFTPSLEHGTMAFGGSYVVVFNTVDKDSGIARYEVKEGNGSWFAATSPYKLRDQSLSADISVKAIDKAGNERVATIHPQAVVSQKRLPNYIILLVIVVVLTIFFRRKIFNNRGE